MLRFYPLPSEPIHIRLGITTAQDLACDLGSPLRTFYKEDDRMAIHSRTRSDEDNTDPSCTVVYYPNCPFAHIMCELDFYNYFQHGIDFLISDHTHIVKKIILHTNVVRVCVQV